MNYKFKEVYIMKKKSVSVGDTVMNVLSALSVLFLAWLVLSFIDVNLHNLDPNSGGAAAWNAFRIMVDLAS